jgi:hypothetical protein
VSERARNGVRVAWKAPGSRGSVGRALAHAHTAQALPCNPACCRCSGRLRGRAPNPLALPPGPCPQAKEKDGLTAAQRKERDAKALQEKLAKKQAADGAAAWVGASSPWARARKGACQAGGSCPAAAFLGQAAVLARRTCHPRG